MSNMSNRRQSGVNAITLGRVVPCISDKSRRGRVMTIGRLQVDGLQRSLLRVTAAEQPGAMMLRSAGLLPTEVWWPSCSPVAESEDTLCWSTMMSPIDRRRDDQLLPLPSWLDVVGWTADKGLSWTLRGRFAIRTTITGWINEHTKTPSPRYNSYSVHGRP